VYVAFVGVGPLLFNPLANSIGRRPLLLASLLGTVTAAVASGFSKTFVEIIIFRSLNGLFASICIGLGSVIVCDLFYTYERGLYMGIYMVVQFSGGHLAPILGGGIYRAINWRFCFFLPAIVCGVLFLTLALTFPETLYSRAVESLQRPYMSLYQQELIRKKREDGRRLKISHFLHPVKMLKYPSVLLPSIYYAAVSGYANMIFVVSSAALFNHFYHFKAWQTGLLLGTPLTLGSWVGEFGAGGFSDWVTERRAVARGKRIPEDRLLAMWPGVILAPVGLVVEGICVKHQMHWAGAGLGIGIASAGFQIVTTVTYAYVAECYPQQTAETATVLNFSRQMFSFALPWYNFVFIHKVSVQTAFLVYAAAELASFVPIVVLILKGADWRDRLGTPGWNLDL
jgi:MFS family permease